MTTLLIGGGARGGELRNPQNANFALHDFCELRRNGVLRSSHSPGPTSGASLAIGIGAGLMSTTNCQERDRVWLFGGMDTSLSASSGMSTGSWRIFSRPLAFFSSEGMRSSQVSISARVRSAHASTVFKRLMKKSTAKALM